MHRLFELCWPRPARFISGNKGNITQKNPSDQADVNHKNWGGNSKVIANMRSRPLKRARDMHCVWFRSSIHQDSIFAIQPKNNCLRRASEQEEVGISR